MDQVVRAAAPEEIARVDARQKRMEAKAAAEATPVKFVNDSEGARQLVVPLHFPVEWEGAVIGEVTISRPRMKEWRAYWRACQDAVRLDGPGADDLVDQPWLNIPAIVYENLDFIDATRVEAAQEGFFERSSPAGGTETTGMESSSDDSSSTSTSGGQSPSE